MSKFQNAKQPYLITAKYIEEIGPKTLVTSRVQFWIKVRLKFYHTGGFQWVWTKPTVLTLVIISFLSQFCYFFPLQPQGVKKVDFFPKFSAKNVTQFDRLLKIGSITSEH